MSDYDNWDEIREDIKWRFDKLIDFISDQVFENKADKQAVNLAFDMIDEGEIKRYFIELIEEVQNDIQN